MPGGAGLTLGFCRPELNVYRGQSNSKWKLRSSATRYLSGTRDDSSLQPIVFISYHKDILMKARREGFGIEYGQELFDLQLLAELQHFGAPTGLLDFTWNPLVAMWFASRDGSRDGKLFSINTNNPGNVYGILGNKANQDISKLFSHQFRTGAPVSIWEPTLRSTARDRMLVMSSVFVVGPPKFTEYYDIVSEITIEKEDKKHLRRELDCLNINEQNLFRDLFGFAQTRGAKLTITEHSTENDHPDDNKFNQGITYFQQDDFHSAICIFDSLIKSNRNKTEYHLYSGITNIRIKNYIQAVENFDEYFSLKGGNHLAYYFREVAKFELGDTKGAIKDFHSAIDIQSNNVMTYFYRSALMNLLGKYKKMILDSKKAIELEPFFVKAYYNCAYANYMLEQYEEAIEYFTKVLQFDPKDLAVYYGRACAYYVLEMYEHAVQDFSHAIELDSEYADAFEGRAYANKKLGRSKNYEEDLEIAYQLKPELAE